VREQGSRSQNPKGARVCGSRASECDPHHEEQATCLEERGRSNHMCIERREEIEIL